MKLRCLIGSIGFVGERESVNRGDIFEVSETQAKTLIEARYAVAVEDTQPTPKKEDDTIKKRRKP